MRARLYAGPTYFHVIHEKVDTIAYTPLVPSGAGPHVGLGAFLHMSRGAVTLVDYSGAFEVKAGRVQCGGGLRLRF